MTNQPKVVITKGRGRGAHHVRSREQALAALVQAAIDTCGEPNQHNRSTYGQSYGFVCKNSTAALNNQCLNEDATTSNLLAAARVSDTAFKQSYLRILLKNGFTEVKPYQVRRIRAALSKPPRSVKIYIVTEQRRKFLESYYAGKELLLL